MGLGDLARFGLGARQCKKRCIAVIFGEVALQFSIRNPLVVFGKVFFMLFGEGVFGAPRGKDSCF